MALKGTTRPPTPRNTRPRNRSRETIASDLLKQQAKDFNRCYPVGTRVRYWRGAREGQGLIGFTRYPAEVLGGHTPVVWICGCSGCIALSHVEPLDAPLEKVKAAVADFSGEDED